jgi:hypothetical protein
MRIILLYRGSKPEDLAEFSPEVVDVDTRGGQDLARLYAATTYPAVIVAQGDGSLVEIWQGKIPSRGELLHAYSPLS